MDPKGDPSRPAPPRLLPLLIATSTLAASLGVTALVWRREAAAMDRQLRSNFEYRVRDAEQRIDARVKEYEVVLRGVAGLFATSEEVDRRAFRRYVASIDLPTGSPGIQALGFQQLVPAEALPRHLATMRQDGLPEYRIRPEGTRALLAPVVYVEPFSGANPGVLGFDSLAEPTRRAAMEQARDTGQLALSGRITLVQDPGTAPTPAGVLYLPIFRVGASPTTVAERRGMLVGWVYLAFRFRDMMDGLCGERGGDLDVELYDGERPSADHLLYDQNEGTFALGGPTAGHGAEARRFEAGRPLSVAGHLWTLAVRSTGRFEQRLGADQPRVIAVAGVLLSVLLSLVALLLANSRARVQDALQRSESLYRLLTRSFPNGMVGLFDRDLRYQLMDGTNTVDTTDPRSLVGKTVADLSPPDLLPELEAAHRSALDGRAVKLGLEVQGHALETIVQPVVDATGTVTMGMLMTQDVTDRKRAEAQARAASSYARSLLEASLDPLVTISPAGKITDVNAATEVVTGVPRAQLIGSDFSASFTEPERARAGYQEALARGALRDHALTIRHASGRTSEVLFNATVYRDPDGAVQGLFAAARDVTEVRALQAKLAIASRVTALGTLAAGVAHQINNPLAAELANQELALEVVCSVRARLQGSAPHDPAAKVQLLEEAIEALQEAQIAGQRVASIVKDMSALARHRAAGTRGGLAALVSEALRQLPGAGERTDRVQVRDLGAPDVLVDADLIRDLVARLVSNAEQASGGLRDGIVVQVGPGGPGLARLEVIDHGSGIEPANLDRVFDPFFTTRPVGEGRGTGLGLAVCHAVAMAHGGALTVESELGKGSVFTLELPVAPDDA